MESDPAAIKAQFHRIFGPGQATERLHVIRAPGRVNLIGEHTDYNDGFVLPMAIEPEVRIVCRARTDGVVRLVSTVFVDQPVEFSVQSKIEPSPHGAWDNYARGVAAELVRAGIPLVGMNALISNTLPVGGGLSSSAAIEVGTAKALLTLAGVEMDSGRLALLCQKAEHDFAGVPVGIMDQTIVAAARSGHALLLDCRSLARQYVPIDMRDLRVVVANSMVRHELSGGEYGKRRRECEEGVSVCRKHNPEVKSLRDATLPQIESIRAELSDVVFRRCRHVVSEIARTSQAAIELTHRNYEQFGALMLQSHNSLRDDYQVSIPELDFLVEESMKVKGVYGARMTGGGFGGCIVALVQPRAAQPLAEHLKKIYPTRFGKEPSIFATTATAGANVVE